MNRVLCFSIILLLSVSLFSVEYGASVDDTLALSNTDFSNNIKVALWLNLEKDVTKFEVKGSFTANSASEFLFPSFMDIDLLKFSSGFKSSSEEMPDTKFAIGRWPMADQTGYVVAHKLDGLYLNFKYPVLNLYTNFAYSGLLWKATSGISPSALDAIYAADDTVILGSPRFIGLTGVKLQPIFDQTLSIEVVYQIDLRDDALEIDEFTNYAAAGDEAIIGGGMLDTYYVSAKITGDIPLLPNFNYKAIYIFNGGSTLSNVKKDMDYYEYSDIIAHLAALKLEKFFPSFYNSVISYSFVYSSGDADYNGYQEGNYIDNAENFLPITRSGFGAVFSPSLGNIIVNNVSYSLKPLGELQTVVNAFAFTRPTIGPISEDGINPDSTSLFLGTEFDVTANYRPLSDLGLSLTAGFYFPSAAAYDATFLEDNSVQTSVSLNISFSI